MTTLLAATFSTPALTLLLGLFLPDGRMRRTAGPLATLLFLLWLLAGAGSLGPEARLLGSSLWLLYWIKGWALLGQPRTAVKEASPLGLLLYAYLWPGIDPRPFYRQQDSEPNAARWFVYGFPTMALGVLGGLLLAVWAPCLSGPALGMAGVMAVLVTIHLGTSDVISAAVSLLGFPVKRLFEHPLACRSLRDFWSKRWNRPFVEMNRMLFQPLLPSSLGADGKVVALFLLSGLLHELALSFPAGGGWGGPLLYFLVQGLAMRAEYRWGIEQKPWSRLWTWTLLLGPLPLLFHSKFLTTLVVPLYEFLHRIPALSDWPSFLATALTLAAYGHFLVLVASFQVPHRLQWKEELSRLRPLNRKLLWTYGGYIASFILLWGLVTLYLLPEMLAGDKSARVLLFLIALFWWSRIVVDAFYFDHSDWPQGTEFVLGHTMLTTLFATLAVTYTTVLVQGLF